MILADTSIWVDHLTRSNSRLRELLTQGQIAIHPFVIGELALGNLARRDRVLADLAELRSLAVVSNPDVLQFIARQHLYGSGIGYVDAHLLSSVEAASGSKLWTRDRRLNEAAAALVLAFEP